MIVTTEGWRISIFKYLPLLGLLVLFFCQLWLEAGSMTIRTEDLLAIFLAAAWLSSSLLALHIRYYPSPLNWPLILFGLAILAGIVTSWRQPLPPIAKQDAVVNGMRLLLSLSLFFIVYHYPLTAAQKAKTLLATVIAFSLVTTAVALLQIAFWEGWLPFRLPPILFSLKDEANKGPGREIFALFLGNTGTHVWTAMLAMQALTVWVVITNARHMLYRVGGMLYFLILGFILLRTAVRNTLLGLVFAVAGLTIFLAWHSRYPWNRLLKPATVFLLIALMVALLFTVNSDVFFLERVRQVVPQLSREGVVINRNSNIFERVYNWRVALYIFQHYPITGGGFWSYQTLSGGFGRATYAHAHNSYLQVLAELGLVGALAMIWLGWRVAFYLRFVGRHLVRDVRWLIPLWQLTIVGLLFMLFTALFANPFWQPKQVGFCMVLLGVLMSFSRELSIQR